MKNYWLVVQKYFDNGKVEVSKEIVEKEEEPQDKFVSTKNFDCYYDYFEDEAEADKFYKKAKQA